MALPSSHCSSVAAEVWTRGTAKERNATGSPWEGRRPTEAEPAPDRYQYFSCRKLKAALRILCGEDLDGRSRELRVAAITLSEWRDDFLAVGQAGLKLESADEPEDRTRELLTTLIGNLTIDNECLKALLRRHGERVPLAFQKWKQ